MIEQHSSLKKHKKVSTISIMWRGTSPVFGLLKILTAISVIEPGVAEMRLLSKKKYRMLLSSASIKQRTRTHSFC